MIQTPPRVDAHFTEAPEENPHPHERGIAVAMPYSQEVVGRIKMLPDWTWTWRPDESVWVVDILVWPYVSQVLREEWGREQAQSRGHRSSDAPARDEGEDSGQEQASLFS